MKYVSNTTKNPINYKDKTIPPGASVMLNNKGEVVDEITDNTEELEKLRGEISKAVTLAQVDARLEEIECKTKTLVTSCTSKAVFDLGSYSPIYNEACLHRTDGMPVELFCTSCCFPLNIEPGLYLGNLPGIVDCCICNIPLGAKWDYVCCLNSNCCYSTCHEQAYLRFSVQPTICYKTRYMFCGGSGSIYEIDEEAAKKSHVYVVTMLKEKNRPKSCSAYKWTCQINEPYECVKNCLQDIDTLSVCLSGTMTRLQ